MSVDVFLTDAQRELAYRARSWVEQHIYSDPGKEDEDIDQEGLRLLAKVTEGGWTSYVVPAQFGGIEKTVETRSLAVIREELARGSSLADSMFALQGLGSFPITLAGTDAQRKRYLPAVGEGEAVAAFALTEPEAGSDVGAITTRAQKKADRYIINGTKCLISNAGIAATYIVFASTDTGAGSKGLSAFVVEGSSPGLKLKEKTELIAPHPNGSIELKDCEVAESQRLGEEGQGIKIALTTLDKFRPTVGAAACGLAGRALKESLHTARERRQFGSPIAEFQAIQFKLADMATELDASRLLVYRAAHARDTQEGRTTLESAMAKLFSTEAAQRIIDQAVQIHGGRGITKGAVVERLYREIRALRIYEGTSEIQHLVIARELLERA